MSQAPSDRLYNLLPALYRSQDVAQGGPLRALLALLDQEVRIVERDIERLYENLFIETCDEWVVPYIADLVGVKRLRAAIDPRFSRRPQVANALAYRRRKGTAGMVEQLARDVSGWPTRLVEFNDRIATTQHMNHVRLRKLGTPVLDQPALPELPGSAFSMTPLTADVRSPAQGGTGGLGCVGLYQFVLRAACMEGVIPGYTADGLSRTFSPLGHDIPLFNIPNGQGFERTALQPLHVARRLRRPLLQAWLRRLQAGSDVDPAEHELPFGIWIKDGDLSGTVPPHKLVVRDLRQESVLRRSQSFGAQVQRPRGQHSEFPRIEVDPELGRFRFVDWVPQEVSVDYAYGVPCALGATPLHRDKKPLEDLVDSLSWIMAVGNEAIDPVPRVPTFRAALAEWNRFASEHPGTSGLIVCTDSRTYDEDLSREHEVRIPAGCHLFIVAARWTAENVLSDEAMVESRAARARLAEGLRGAGEDVEAELRCVALRRAALSSLLAAGESLFMLSRLDAALLAVRTQLSLEEAEKLKGEIVELVARTSKLLPRRAEDLLNQGFRSLKQIGDASQKELAIALDLASEALPVLERGADEPTRRRHEQETIEYQARIDWNLAEVSELQQQVRLILRQVAQLRTEGVCPLLRGSFAVRGSAPPGKPGGDLTLMGLYLDAALVVRPGTLGSLRLLGCTVAPDRGITVRAPRPRFEARGNAQGEPSDPPRRLYGMDRMQQNRGLRIALSRCVTGPIEVQAFGATISLEDSVIVGSLRAPRTAAEIHRCTILPSARGDGLPSAAEVPEEEEPVLQPEPRYQLVEEISWVAVVDPNEAFLAIERVRYLEEHVDELEDHELDLMLVPQPGPDPETRGSAFHVAVRSLSASNTLFTGTVLVQRRQEGCVRFCHVPEGSRTPRRFRCVPEEGKPLDSPSFRSIRIHDPGFAQLCPDSPPEIREGGEDGSEMGVFYQLKQAQRDADLRTSLGDYLCLGIQAHFYPET